MVAKGYLIWFRSNLVEKWWAGSFVVLQLVATCNESLSLYFSLLLFLSFRLSWEGEKEKIHTDSCLEHFSAHALRPLRCKFSPNCSSTTVHLPSHQMFYPLAEATHSVSLELTVRSSICWIHRHLFSSISLVVVVVTFWLFFIAYFTSLFLLLLFCHKHSYISQLVSVVKKKNKFKARKYYNLSLAIIICWFCHISFTAVAEYCTSLQLFNQSTFLLISQRLKCSPQNMTVNVT